jgi:hypothetical protein
MPRKWVNGAAACNQGIRLEHVASDFLRGAIAPRLLALLDSFVPPSLSDTGLKVGSYLGNVLTLTHHAASHLVTVRINC